MNTNSNFKPYACKEAIKDCAERLLELNGMTTTLEVKVDLRFQGYVAFQSDVAHWMDRIAKEEGWSYTSNGKHRVYSFARPAWVKTLLTVCPN